MKVLLTGGTGFLGKIVLRRLIEEDAVTLIYCVSRTKKWFPHSKVKVILGDLAAPETLEGVRGHVDVVLHLSGSYNFNDGFAQNYMDNVAATTNLTSFVAARRRSGHKLDYHFSSTYAVGIDHWQEQGPEATLKSLPDRSHHYARSKAECEKIVKSTVKDVCIYRLGILVGRSTDGYIEKIDGPYYILNLLEKARFLPARLRKCLPVFGDKDCFVPLVPVDSAADVIVRGVLEPQKHCGKVYGVYRQESTKLSVLLEEMIKQSRYEFGVKYLKYPGKTVMDLQNMLTGIPSVLFAYAAHVPNLKNSKFQEAFGDEAIPRWESYREKFFQGFANFYGKSSWSETNL